MELLPALRARIALATQKDTIQGMFTENSLTLASQVRSPEFADKLRREFLGNKKLVSFFRYPASDLLNIMEATVKDDPKPEALLEEFGANAVRIFFESPVGKTMILLGGNSPTRLMASAPAGFKACASFGDRVYKSDNASSGVIETKGDLLGPSWTAGVIKYALEAACSIKATVETTDISGDGLNYTTRVKW